MTVCQGAYNMPFLCLRSTVCFFYVWWKDLRFFFTARKRSCEVSPSLEVFVPGDGYIEPLNQAAMGCTRGSNATKHRLSLTRCLLATNQIEAWLCTIFLSCGVSVVSCYAFPRTHLPNSLPACPGEVVLSAISPRRYAPLTVESYK